VFTRRGRIRLTNRRYRRDAFPIDTSCTCAACAAGFTRANGNAVMNKGKIVEAGPAEKVYTNPKDEYTKALLAAVPVPDPHRMRERKDERRKHKHALAESI